MALCLDFKPIEPHPKSAMEKEKTPPTGFTPGEIKVFKIHAVLVAALAASFAVVAPSGPGQVLGALFAVLLLPIPPLVVYLLRRRKSAR